MKKTLFFIATLSLCIAAPLMAAPSEKAPQTAEEFLASLKFRGGSIDLPGGRTALDVPAGFRYLDPKDAERVLVQAWGNPSGAGTLGMLFPAERSPLDKESWGVVLTYSGDGHISDDDAASIDYTKMLQDMQAEEGDENAERTRRGYEPVHTVGWAEKPFYDQANRKLYWAKELKFGDAKVNTLNYNIRVLGRDGVLVLTAVASMDQLPVIREKMKDVLAFSNFKEGYRYADFNPATDKVASYGLAALVGGAVAAKTGLLAKLIAILIAAKKLIAVAVIALVGGLIGYFRRKKAVETKTP